MFEAYTHYFDFSGRAARKEFWLFFLWYGILAVIALIVDYGLLGWTQRAARFGFYGPTTWLVILTHFIPWLAVTVRRLHDKDKSGWCYFLVLIPLVGPIILLVWFCQAGTPGPNRFGPQMGDEGYTVVQYSHHNVDAPRANTQGPNDDGLQKLERLGRLRDQGVLTEAEFAVQKAAVLGGTV